MNAPIPAGWYHNPDGSATMRYWDGQAWTPSIEPLPETVQPTAGEPADFGSSPAAAAFPPGQSWPATPPPLPPMHPAGNYPMPPVGGTNGLAVTSLVSSLVYLCGLGSLIAVVTGHIARSQIKQSHGRQSGSGIALAGLILGYLGLLATAAALAFFVLVANQIEENPDQFAEFFSDTAVQIDLQEAAVAQGEFFAANGSYARSIDELQMVGFVPSGGEVYEGGQASLEFTTTSDAFCMSATSAQGNTFHFDSQYFEGSGPCPDPADSVGSA